MASPHPFEADDALASLNSTGLYVLNDHVVGTGLLKLRDARFPLRTSVGLDFIAKHSFVKPGIQKVLKASLDKPYFGLAKVFSQRLPRDYIFSIHNGSIQQTCCCLLVQLWSPGTIVHFYEGLRSDTMQIDLEVSKQWGLIATPKSHVRREGIIERETHLDQGGITISDSRLPFSIIQGYTLLLGFTTKDEIDNWAKMELLYSEELQAKVKELERYGTNINYTWFSPPS